MVSGNRFHYGWIILVVGIIVMLACLGLGRFAIGMLLPSMGEALDLNYTRMGTISTANFTGYMFSVMVAGPVSRRLGERLTISIGLAIVGLSMLVIWQAAGFWTVLLPYVFTGIGSGLANIPMMGLVAGWFATKWRGRAAGCMLIGNGLGIIFPGLIVPFLNVNFGAAGWRFAWLLMGGTVLFAFVLAGTFLRNRPADIDQEPLGSYTPADSSEKSRISRPHHAESPPPLNLSRIFLLGGIYFLFGTSFAIFVTFIVTYLINEWSFTEGTAGMFWSAVGTLSLGSGFWAGFIADRFSRRFALVTIYCQFTIAYLLSLTGLPLFCIYLSIIIFGLSLWGIPTIMTATVGDLVGPERAASVFGIITIFLGGGQIIGPTLAGMAAESLGSFTSVFFICALMTGIAALLSATLVKN